MPTACYRRIGQPRTCREVAIWPSARCRFDVAGTDAAGRPFRQQPRPRAGLKSASRPPATETKTRPSRPSRRRPVANTREFSRLHPPTLSHARPAVCIPPVPGSHHPGCFRASRAGRWSRPMVHSGRTPFRGHRPLQQRPATRDTSCLRASPGIDAPPIDWSGRPPPGPA